MENILETSMLCLVVGKFEGKCKRKKIKNFKNYFYTFLQTHFIYFFIVRLNNL